MNIKNSLIALSIVAATTATCFASSTPLKHFSKTQRHELDAYVKDYIMAHPQVIVQAIQKMQMEAQLKQIADGKKAVVANAKNLVSDQTSPAVNNGRVTLVEFFDYQCSVCHMVYPAVEKFSKAHQNVRIVYKPFPIFGPASQYAAKAAIASRLQGEKAFLAFHQAMFKSHLMEGKLKDKDVDAIAEKVDLNMAELKRDMNSKAVENELKSTFKLAQNIKLSGTPAFMMMPTNPKDKKMLQRITFIPGGTQEQGLNQALAKIVK